MAKLAKYLGTYKPFAMNTSSTHMKSSLAYLPAARRGELERVKEIIIDAVQPEKVILFGVYGSAQEAEIFSGLPEGLSAYDLLVVTRNSERRSDYQLQDMIENRCKDSRAVTILVHDIGYVNSRIAEGQCFFAAVRREGILLYDSGGSALVQPGETNLEQVLRTAEQDFARWCRQARAFLRSAQVMLDGGEWKVALFMLHQAAEQMYQAILLTFMGYKPTTHNLDKLRRYTNRFSIELALLFPRSEGEEDRLFRLLLSGYVEARYKDGFHVAEPDARLLTSRVGRLLEIGERVCRNRMLALEKQLAKL